MSRLRMKTKVCAFFNLTCYQRAGANVNLCVASSLLEAGARALNSIPHVNAMEGLYAYNKVKSKLSSFLKPFAEDGRIVSEQDVKAFFEKIKNA